MVRLRDMSEAEFLRRLRRGMGRAAGPVRIGVGDDAAVLSCPPGYCLVLTCDAAVEGRHFRREWLSATEIADRAVRACVSDLAAMGAQPAAVLLTLIVSPDEEEALASSLIEGAAQAAEALGARLVGGETVGSDGPLTLDAIAAGFVREGRELRRDGAQPGDVLCVSGHLGGSAAGLAALRAGLESESAKACIGRYKRPEPRVALGQLLSEGEGVHAAIDVSDGLVRDAGHIAEQSGVAITIGADAFPLFPGCGAVAEALSTDAVHWALGGGEDFELLFSVDPHALGALRTRIARELGLEVTEIGHVAAGEGVGVVGADGAELAVPSTGWDQFTDA